MYIHLPFCSGRCHYCDFVSNVGRGRAVPRYLDALEAESRLRAFPQPETLYVGGGTPTELDAKQLADLFALIGRSFPSARWRESTVEANPENLDREKLGVLKGNGVTRLSLGLQTSDDRLLRRIGRRHDYADFLRAYGEARAAGFSVSMDLMFGLPGQTIEGLSASIEAVLALEPEHLSVYGLDVHEGTPFGREGARCDEDLGREMFELVIDRLTRAGYHHYEISNFALPGRECVHNQIYWRNGEYVGLGCAASSCINGERSTNVERLDEYCSRALSGKSPVAHSERLSGKERLGEEVMLGLRLLDGVELEPEAKAAFASEIESLRGRGLVVLEGARLRLTREGLFLANLVFLEFVAPFAGPIIRTGAPVRAQEVTA
ncbi:MAG: radical SAM family heme chaperone HemW [Elusimicrobia bacterium]|nr:radical SAM family heme chaperone HemW [Elusimicrobiota bacterium]